MAHGDGNSNGHAWDLTPFLRVQRSRHEEKGSTLSIFLPPQADWGLRDELLDRMFALAEEIYADRADWDPAMVATFGDVFHVDSDEHVYLSTSCFHDQHTYCQSETGACGHKIPGQCKFCAAPCVCPCHVKTPGHQGPAKREEEDDHDEQPAPESPEESHQAAAA